MLYTTKFEKVKGKQPLLIASICIMFVLQLMMTIFFASGLIEYYGANISVIGAIELILGITNITFEFALEYLLNLALGIGYFICAIIIIKVSIVSISCFFRGIFAKNSHVEEEREMTFCSLFICVGATVKCCFVFIFLSIMTSVDFKITDLGKAVLILGAITYLLTHVLFQYLKNFDIKTIVYKSIATLIMMTAFILLSLSLKVASFEGLIVGLKAVFGGYLGQISTNVMVKAILLIVVPILYICIQICLMSFLIKTWQRDEHFLNLVFSRAKAKGIMSLVIAVVVINVVASFFVGNLETLGVFEIYSIIVNEISMLLPSIVLFIDFDFAKFERKRLVIKDIKMIEKEKRKIEETSMQKKEVKEFDVKNYIGSTDITNELIKCKDLFEKGLISQEEYTEAKKKILGI